MPQSDANMNFVSGPPVFVASFFFFSIFSYTVVFLFFCATKKGPSGNKCLGGLMGGINRTEMETETETEKPVLWRRRRREEGQENRQGKASSC